MPELQLTWEQVEKSIRSESYATAADALMAASPPQYAPSAENVMLCFLVGQDGFVAVGSSQARDNVPDDVYSRRAAARHHALEILSEPMFDRAWREANPPASA